MREILFRGKRCDNGEWVYGYYGLFKGRAEIFVTFTEEEEKANEGHIFSAIGGLWYKVITETVGQFSGLIDKKGKKIFEGDIVKSYSMFEKVDGSGVVYWNNKFCSWHFDEYKSMYSEPVATYEVIDNIHDNPELLK